MLENLLWAAYDHAEFFSFLLVWLVIPLSFLAIYFYVHRVSMPIVSIEPEKKAVSPLAPSPQRDKKVNLNEANA